MKDCKFKDIGRLFLGVLSLMFSCAFLAIDPFMTFIVLFGSCLFVLGGYMICSTIHFMLRSKP